MMSKPAISPNNLLAALPIDVYDKLIPKFEQFDLDFAETVYDRGDTYSHVYFIESGIVSLLVAVDDQSTIEVGMVGSEGMVGLPVFLGVKVSQNRAVVQGSGHALRMTAEKFAKECLTGADLSRVMRLFTYSILMQVARSAVCNRFHPTDSRLARWLLMTQDRIGSDHFQITQEFLSYMVGVRREAVNKAATGLQRKGMISYVRGSMIINDRYGLEALACSCYGLQNGGVPVMPASNN